MERQDPLNRLNEEQNNAINAPEKAQGTIESIQQQLSEQLRMIEYLNLMQDLICGAEGDRQSLTDYDLLQQYIDLHSTREEALATLETFLTLFNQLEWRGACTKILQKKMGREEDEYFEYAVGHVKHNIVDLFEKRSLSPFTNLQEEIRDCMQLPDSEERRAQVNALDARLNGLMQEHVILRDDFDNERERVTTQEDFLYSPLRIRLIVQIGGEEESFGISLKGMIQDIKRMKYEEYLNDNLPLVDHQRIHEETALYGAKNANLREMNRVLQVLNKVMEGNYIHVHIPEFTEIPASLYDAWKQGEDISEALQSFYSWMNGRKMHVRSSAVYGEDNETVTGAGIYDTVAIEADASFQVFQNAVLQVYQSVDSEQAIAHLARNGVEKESMGITLQKTVDAYDLEEGKEYDSFGQRGSGTINSSRAFAPTLSDASLESGQRPIFIKEAVLEGLALQDHNRDIFFYQVDRSDRYSGYTLLEEACAQIAYIVERMYGKPVQIEFVSNDAGFHIVQTRVLPKAHSNTASISFPEQEQLYTLDATGIIDDELEILSLDQRNKDKKGVMIFHHSHNTSDNCPQNYFPKEGAVIVLSSSRDNGGHIETQCIERGLVCLFQSNYERRQNPKDLEFGYGFSPYGHRLPSITSINGMNQIRLVANGLEGRIYPPIKG